MLQLSSCHMHERVPLHAQIEVMDEALLHVLNGRIMDMASPMFPLICVRLAIYACQF